MRNIISTLLCTFVGVLPVLSQGKADNRKPVEIPQSYGIVTTINQKDSPIEFEEVLLFTDETGSFPQLRYVVRNRTSKPIVYLSVEFIQRSAVKSWGRYSDGWIENSGEEASRRVIIDSGDSFANIPKMNVDSVLDERRVLSLFDDGTDKPRLLTFWLGFVKKVKFSDGTEYTSKIDGKSLTDLLLQE